MNCRSLRNSNGFTLLEVLISVLILAFISLGVYDLTVQNYRVRQIVLRNSDFYHEVRLSMGILENDLSLMFTPDSMVPSPAPTSSPSPGQTGQSGQTTGNPFTLDGSDDRIESEYWGRLLDRNGNRASRFNGMESFLSFISSSNVRVYKESPESVFIKVKYSLMDPTENREEIPEGKVLVRIIDTNTFALEDKPDEKSVKIYPILYGVRRIQFKYYEKERDRWNSSWDSESQDLLGKYPDMVEVELEVNGPETLQFGGKFRFRPEIPTREIKTTI